MKFEYFTFEVEPYLAQGNQPEFAWTDVAASKQYHTLVDAENTALAVTAAHSDGVRIPVHAVATSFPDQQDEDVKKLTHGSMLFAMGMENAFKAVQKLDRAYVIERVIIVMATNCHELAGQRYRAYFGLTIETQK